MKALPSSIRQSSAKNITIGKLDDAEKNDGKNWQKMHPAE
jgi:hypothetical protein